MAFLQTNSELAFIPLTFSPGNANASATHLVLTIFPEWKASELKFVRFTDGITNTLLKCVRTIETTDPDTGVQTSQVQESDSLLIRAYGKGSNVLIDRERECQSHWYLCKHGLAPPLLARFNNGLIYRYIPGRIASVEDLSKPVIYTSVATRLGQWHGTIDATNVLYDDDTRGPKRRISPISGVPELVEEGEEIPPQIFHPLYGGASGESGLWNALYKWIEALPDDNDEQKTRKDQLEKELEWLARDSGLKGLGEVVYAHCDLLHGNVIILPQDQLSEISSMILPAPLYRQEDLHVTFIDYEYGTPAERAFDLANHFAEWGGFECNYSLMPTQSARRDFIKTYLKSCKVSSKKENTEVSEEEVAQLMDEVDQFRGLPGFYWGIWALIQAVISQIDFDYAAYAEVRLHEYWTWKKTLSEKIPAEQQTLRETLWNSA